MKTHKLHYPMIQFLIILVIPFVPTSWEDLSIFWVVFDKTIMSLALVVRPSLAIFHLVLTRARGTIVYKTLR